LRLRPPALFASLLVAGRASHAAWATGEELRRGAKESARCPSGKAVGLSRSGLCRSEPLDRVQVLVSHEMPVVRDLEGMVSVECSVGGQHCGWRRVLREDDIRARLETRVPVKGPLARRLENQVRVQEPRKRAPCRRSLNTDHASRLES